jgi:hypothetical protein
MLLFFFRPHVYAAIVYRFSEAAQTSIGYLPDRTIGPIP